MSVLFVAPQKAMALGQGRIALWRSLQTSGSGGTTGTPKGPATPAAIAGTAAWWDASTLAGVADISGHPVTGWYQASSGLIDKSGNGNVLASFASVPSDVPLIAAPRIAGMLGGVGGLITSTELLSPTLSPSHGLVHTGGSLGSGGNWTWWLVWSRPNWRQGTNNNNAPTAILTAGSTPVLQIDNAGGTGQLILLPTGTNAILLSNLTRRHTHSVILRNSVSTGLDIWLDGTKVGSSLVCSLPATPSEPIYLLHDGTPIGAAQCWFHEAATWPRALNDTEIATLETYASRWPTGPRRGVMIVVDGQSNSVNYALNDGAALLLAQGIAWHIGALAYNIIASTGSAAAYTMESGHGIYPAVNGTYPGSFLNPAGAGATTDPSTWPLGADGLALTAALQNVAAEDLADICALIWPWNETDSLRGYSEEATFSGAAVRFLTLERSMIGLTAARLPLIWWNAIPYGTAPGMQMHREVTASLARQGSINVVIGNPQTSDSNPRGAAWDPTTGLSTGGDSAHRDGADNQRFARLAAPVAARAVIAAGHTDTISAIVAGVPVIGGPNIKHVYRQNNTTLILTIQHDCGTDLIVPLQAATGAGFAVMDGGSIANPGNLISASSCVRSDATHLTIILASSLVNPSTGCGLYYPHGSTMIGRGNAVTDNYASVMKPANWDIASDLGPAWSLNYPLAATSSPIVLSDTPM